MRCSAEAWSDWLIAGEHIRSGDWIAARPFLMSSLMKEFDVKRAGVLFFALCGGVPKFLQRRYPDVRRYDFAAVPGTPAPKVAETTKPPRQEPRSPGIASGHG
jgi:hypothetical protein